MLIDQLSFSLELKFYKDRHYMYSLTLHHPSKISHTGGTQQMFVEYAFTVHRLVKYYRGHFGFLK